MQLQVAFKLSEDYVTYPEPNAKATLDKQSCVITPTFVYHD